MSDKTIIECVVTHSGICPGCAGPVAVGIDGTTLTIHCAAETCTNPVDVAVEGVARITLPPEGSASVLATVIALWGEMGADGHVCLVRNPGVSYHGQGHPTVVSEVVAALRASAAMLPTENAAETLRRELDEPGVMDRIIEGGKSL